MTIGIVLFDDAEELDFAGPWEVFTSAAMLKGGGRVVTIAESDRPVRCAKGMRVRGSCEPDGWIANCCKPRWVISASLRRRAVVSGPAWEWCRTHRI